MDKKQSGRLAQLRKYIPTPEDAEMVKEMIQDGLTDQQILESLGFVGEVPSTHVLPNGHKYANKLTAEQEEKENQAAGIPPPGGVAGDEEDEGGGGGNELISHIVGLLNHAQGKPKKTPKGPAKG